MSCARVFSDWGTVAKFHERVIHPETILNGVMEYFRTMNTRILVFMMLSMILLCGGCGAEPGQEKTKERIRSEVARILNRDSAQIDVAKPLGAQGADELDIVEIVLAVEEAFEVKIPDKAIGEDLGDVTRSLTVQRLAEIVSKQQKK